MDTFTVFFFYIFPPLVLILGLFGNIFGYYLLKRPKMSEIGPRNTYKFLFALDTINLIQIIVNYLQFSFKTDITIISNVSCRLWVFINYSLATPSSMCLVYISIDRYISIKLPAKRYFLRKRNNQFIFITFIIVFNLIYYLPVVYSFSIFSTANTTLCNFNDDFSQSLVSYMDLAIRVCLPAFLITAFSILLGIEIIKSQRRILANFQKEENQYYFNEIRMALSSIWMNIIYVSLQLPVSIYSFVPEYYLLDSYMVAYYLYYLSYGINFYAMLFFNSLFNSELISFLKTKLFSKF
jgi:hypothetical protein